MADWSDFNHPFRIQYQRRTRTVINQTTGQASAPIVVAADIEGDFQMNPLEGETRIPGGLIEAGNAVLYTEQQLYTGDQVLVSHDALNSHTTLWRVKGIESDHEWIHDLDSTDNIRGYVLVRVEEG